MEPDEPGPSWATLRSTTNAYTARTYTTEGAIDESTQPCVDMCVSRAGRGSPTSLGLRTLLLDQPQTQPNSGHNIWLMCVFHVIDEPGPLRATMSQPPQLQILREAFSCAHCVYLVIV